MRGFKNVSLMSPVNIVMCTFILAASIHTKTNRAATNDAMAAWQSSFTAFSSKPRKTHRAFAAPGVFSVSPHLPLMTFPPSS